MAYSSTGGLRDYIAGTKTVAVVGQSASTGRPIAAPTGTVVTGVTTPSAPAATGPSTFIKWGIPLALLALGGVFYYRARKKKRGVA